MASKKDQSAAVKDAGPINEHDMDPDMLTGLDEWDDAEGEIVNVKRLFFKPLEAGEKSVLRGYPVGLTPITSTHDGKQVEGTGIVFATTRPARLTGADGVTKPYPAGTQALIYCTDELQDLKVFATGKRVVECAVRMGPRIRTNSGRTLQTMEFKRFPGSATRDEVKVISMSPAVRRLAEDTGLTGSLALGPATNSNPALPQ